MSAATTDTLERNNSDMSHSEKFNAPDAEVVFQSSDGVRFRIHKLNLTTCKEGLSPPEHSTFDEVVILPESSSTLELLFQFIYPQPQPELGAVDFETLALLAEAAEKYRVFPAMNLCSIYMMEHLEDHTEEILLHALKHSVHKLVARAAPLLLDRPLETFLQTLPDCFVIPWVRYHDWWTRVWKFSITSAPVSKDMSWSPCSFCNKIPHQYVLDIIARLSDKLDVLRDINAVFEVPTCCPSTTRELLGSWRDTVRAEIFLIPTFADIVFPGNITELTQEGFEAPEANASLGMTLEPGESPVSTSGPGDEARIKFLSSDGIAFHLCERTLRAWTKNLLTSQHDQQVELPEPSTTLEVLFRFLQASPHPDLEAVDFRILGPLSLAADSYGVYPAQQVCKIRRQQTLEHDLVNRPSVVMGYAIESQDWELMNKTTPFMIGESSVKMVKLIKTSPMIIVWFEYLEKWDEVLQIALSLSESRKVSQHYYNYKGTRSGRGCDGCRVSTADTTTIRIMRKLGKGVKSLRNLDDTFGTLGQFCCSTEREDIQAWRTEVERSIERIPSFSSLLFSSDSDLGSANDDAGGNT